MNGIVCPFCLLVENGGRGDGLEKGVEKSFAFSVACVKVTLCSLYSRPDGASRPSNTPKAAATSTSWHWPFAGTEHFLATIRQIDNIAMKSCC